MAEPLTIEDMISRYHGTSRQIWAQHRYRGTGPSFFKVGKKVFYRKEDVLEWEASLRQERTNELPATDGKSA
ncbi:helix-turn-helix transcriptional regulator [Corynebacterium suicordis]|uniref:helix-turn-helix transcriptional regulator n=1 Tax=Corynebacterium dentalis TaxID=2014528 RepID=UPI00370D2384